MARNPVFLSPHNFWARNESISVEFTSLIVAVFKRISVEYTSWISSLSATQFTVEKSDFRWFATTDRNCFGSTTSNFAQNFTPKNTFGEVNWWNKCSYHKDVSLQAGSRWSRSTRSIAMSVKSNCGAVRQESEPALISAIFLFPPWKLQKRISQLIFTGSMNFGSSDFSGKL